MEATYYKELTEECAGMHGWRDEEQDGEAACFMYREILKRDNQISNLTIVNRLLEDQDIYRLKSSVGLAFGALAFGLFLGWLLL